MSATFKPSKVLRDACAIVLGCPADAHDCPGSIVEQARSALRMARRLARTDGEHVQANHALAWLAGREEDNAQELAQLILDVRDDNPNSSCAIPLARATVPHGHI